MLCLKLGFEVFDSNNLPIKIEDKNKIFIIEDTQKVIDDLKYKIDKIIQDKFEEIKQKLKK